jgi:lysophospholipase L1-like esterase
VADLPPAQGPSFRLEPGQTVIFLGDHTSPDDPGFVRVAREVIARFYPQLRLNLITAGAKGQTASGLRSQKLMEVLLSSRPDWLAINLGLSDVLREPDTRARHEEYVRRKAQAEEGPDATLGPEYRAKPFDLGPQSDVGGEPGLRLERIATFTKDLAAAVTTFQGAGIRPILFTTVLLGSDLTSPLNLTLRAYSKAIRDVAEGTGAALVDVERAFRDVLDRAANYKQSVSLTDAQGRANPQGEALIARNFLHTFGILPGPGFRPKR